jgi:predicted small metal-binding protein
VPLRYECLDAGCGEVISAADPDALVAAVQEHMSSAHDSFELEDVILDTATEVPDDGTQANPEGEANG